MWRRAASSTYDDDDGLEGGGACEELGVREGDGGGADGQALEDLRPGGLGEVSGGLRVSVQRQILESMS